MRYDTTIRECSGCHSEILWVTAMENMGLRTGWKSRIVFKRGCGCGRWMNDRKERSTECPEGVLFSFEEE
jgi:hypothetical protein